MAEQERERERERERTFLERWEHQIARRLIGLPPRVQLLLSGRTPVQADGASLHPELQLLLAMRKRLGAQEVCVLTPEEARRRLRREALVHAGPLVTVGEVRDRVLDTSAGPLRARHYRPFPSTGPAPLLLFIHGGGFVVGDLDTHDPLCRILCRHGGLQVLSVEYRLAPEAPFPAALEDTSAAWDWVAAHASELGADPLQLAIGGDSAGGTLAAVVAQRARALGGPQPALQVLLYPAMDRTTVRASLPLFGEGLFLTLGELQWFQAHYMGGVNVELGDPRISPLCAPDLSGLPPALVVTAGFDPLRDEGEAYAAALARAGTPAVLRRFERMIHAFANMIGVSRACHDAVVEIAERTRVLISQRGRT